MLLFTDGLSFKGILPWNSLAYKNMEQTSPHKFREHNKMCLRNTIPLQLSGEDLVVNNGDL